MPIPGEESTATEFNHGKRSKYVVLQFIDLSTEEELARNFGGLLSRALPGAVDRGYCG
jgi:hypothetical protein